MACVVRPAVGRGCKLACRRYTPNLLLRQFRRSSSSAEQAVQSAPLKKHRKEILDGPGLEYFISRERKVRAMKVFPALAETDTYLSKEDYSGNGRKVHFIVYGCQMNVSDVEIVRSVLLSNGYVETDSRKEADVVLLMTCSVRESAEEKVWNELKVIRSTTGGHQTVGVLGCMAERVRHGLLSRYGVVDVVAGPDSYRDLPRLLAIAHLGVHAINVQLSLEETYADVTPVRLDPQSKTAFVSIMRGCDNMCTYCIVPFTRGRERSRPMESILDEIKKLSDEGVKQVTLLGQNVNSYRDMTELSFPSTSAVTLDTTPGFRTVYKAKKGGRRFLTLLDEVSRIDPEMRIRFTSPHPKDFPLQVIELIKERPNICSQIHLPAQSGSDKVLERMGRGYTQEAYMALVERIRNVIPDVSLSSDFIAGFCGETEEDHQETLKLIRNVKYSFCFVFPYSIREKTRASYRLVDDVPAEVKRRRHEELTETFREESKKLNELLSNTVQLALVESKSKRSSSAVVGRVDGGTKVVFADRISNNGGIVEFLPGDYVAVKIVSGNSQTLQGVPLQKTTLREFYQRWRSENLFSVDSL